MFMLNSSITYLREKRREERMDKRAAEKVPILCEEELKTGEWCWKTGVEISVVNAKYEDLCTCIYI